MAIHGNSWQFMANSWQFVFLKKNILYKTRKKNPNSFLESAVAFLPNTQPFSCFYRPNY